MLPFNEKMVQIRMQRHAQMMALLFSASAFAFLFGAEAAGASATSAMPLPLPQPSSMAQTRRLEGEACGSDLDCVQGQEYCGHGKCMPHGDCGNDYDCINPSNDYITGSTCFGHRTCENGSCFSNCGEKCPEGQKVIDCFIAPCVLQSCATAVNCANIYCDKCQAVHFSVGGFGGCENFPDETTVDPDPDTAACSSDADCSNGVNGDGKPAYCAAGTCMGLSQCQTRYDCFNPSNEYSVDDCTGPIDCVAGLCMRECTGRDCPDSSNFVTCRESACNMLPCPSSQRCTNYYCGGCVALHFDAQGERVCEATSRLSDSSIVKRYQVERRQMEDARELWESHDIHTYDLGFQNQCRCFADFVVQLTASVVDNTVGDVKVRSSGNDAAKDVANVVKTIDELFLIIGSAIDREVNELSIKYHSTFGYPTKVYIDEQYTKADDEMTYLVDFLVPFTAIQQTAEAKESQWTANAFDTYTYTFRRTCQCIDSNLPYEVIVTNGVVTSVNGEEPESVSVSAASTDGTLQKIPTVEELFALIDDAVARKAFNIDVKYDSVHGHPYDIFIDYDEKIVGDEIDYSAKLQTDMQTLPPTQSPAESRSFTRTTIVANVAAVLFTLLGTASIL